MEYRIKGWQRILLIILPYFLVVGVFQILAMSFVGIDINDPDHFQTTSQQLLVAFVGTIGLFLVLWFFMKKVDKEPFINLGFQMKGRLKDFSLGFYIGLFIMLAALGVLWSLDELSITGTHIDINQIMISILLFTIVALSEEALFRGYILRNLMYSCNKYVALIISAALFAIAHGMNPNFSSVAFLDIFLAGILLGLSYIYTKNLWFPIALHFSWNLFQSLFGFNVSGQDFYSMIQFRITENNLINGGAFGFEGSILSIVAQLIFIVWVFFYFRKQAQTF